MNDEYVLETKPLHQEIMYWLWNNIVSINMSQIYIYIYITRCMDNTTYIFLWDLENQLYLKIKDKYVLETQKIHQSAPYWITNNIISCNIFHKYISH